MEITEEDDWNAMLRLEEEYVENMCKEIIAHKPDVVITEKGVSDLAQHYLQKANITAFRRLRKTDNNRIAKAVGATIVSRTDEIQESDIGTGCGLFEMRKLGDDWFCFLEDCQDPKACTVVLRGGSKDVLNEIERNLQDAMQVVRNVVYNPKLLPGGGATEMALAVAIHKEGQSLQGIQQAPFMAVGEAMEVIPRTLAQNCGVSVIRTITELRAKHAAAAASGEKCYVGVNGITGDLVDMNELGIWEPYAVKVQTIKTAIENACMILRIDDIVSGSRKK
jgi:T-complex protein 1 subunit gamma